MKLNVRSLALTFAIIWGGCVFLVAAGHRLWPAYGTSFLDLVSSIYPGYHVGGMTTGLVGTVYAAFDGAMAGALVAWLYNRFSAGANGARPAAG